VLDYVDRNQRKRGLASASVKSGSMAASGRVGGAALMMLLAGNIVTLAGARATAVDISPPFFGPDFPVCLP
jgi:hypothetical protein